MLGASPEHVEGCPELPKPLCGAIGTRGKCLENNEFSCILQIEKDYGMNKIRFIYWNDKDMYLGYLEDYPDYMTQGKTLDELEENLKDIYKDINSGAIPGIRKVGELIIQ
jgi:hypothetical protein